MAKKKEVDMECKTTTEGILIFNPEGSLTREFRAKYPKEAKKWDDSKNKK